MTEERKEIIKQEVAKFDEDHEVNEKEILILVAKSRQGACKSGQDILWTASDYFIAYVDCTTNQLVSKNGRLRWLLEDSDQSPFSFQSESVYKVKVRQKKPFNENSLPLEEYEDFLMLLEVISDNKTDSRLNAILQTYLTPVSYQDEELGKFMLNKQFNCYEGNILWCGQNVSLTIEIDDNNKFIHMLGKLKSLLNKAEIFDKKIRDYSAKKLTGMANDWQYDTQEEGDESTPLTEQEFSKRIALNELVIAENGDFTAFYNDDDMFFGHVILVEGTSEGEFSNAYITG